MLQKKCGVILINELEDGKILIVYSKKSKKYGFPKGGQEESESYSRTALRELREESGYSIKKSNFILDKQPKIYVKNNIYFIVPFHCKKDDFLKDHGIQDTDEIEFKKWYTKEELLELPIKECNLGLSYYINKKL